jgi:2-amino-4-hydroxy-6-hydroxymethyldihydropteridine diphosphokinase
MPRVYLSLGSNVERDKHIRQAVSGLRKNFAPLIVSPVYECPAVGFVGEDFYNLVVGFDSDKSVGDIVAILHQLEDQNGRIRGADKFAARTLDIDLLTYGDVRGVVDGVTLPRDEILKYAFVLKPLTDIAPEEHHPETGCSYKEHWNNFSGNREGLSQVDCLFE